MSDDRVEEVKKNILSPSQWVRIFYMAFYAVACWVLLFVLPVIIVCQVIISLISGRDNENLRDFGGKLSAYFHKALDYLLYVNDEKPWPFVAGDGFAESFVKDDDDSDDDSEKSSEKKDEEFSDISTEENPSSDSEKQSGDDVFADISFTDNADKDVDSDDQSVEFSQPEDDSSSNESDNDSDNGSDSDSDSDSDNDRKNPA